MPDYFGDALATAGEHPRALDAYRAVVRWGGEGAEGTMIRLE